MNVPTIRFPEFEGELQNTKLGDLMAITSASRVHKEEWTEEGVPFFRSSDVVSAYKGTENKKAFISTDLFEKLSKKSGRLVKDDLLVTGGGSIGVPYLVTSNDPLYSKDADLIWLKNGKQTSGQFIYAFLISRVFRKYLKSISHIGTISHYTIEQAKATPIRLPSLPEQKKIAAFLGVVDAKIAALRARVVGLEQYKRGLMQALFSQTLRFTKDDGTCFPDWEEKRLGEVTKWASGGTPSKENPKYWGGDIPWISALTMHVDYISSSKLYVSNEGLRAGSKLAPKDTVLLLVRGSMLYNRIPISKAQRDVAFNQDVKSLNPRGKLSSDFLFYWLKSTEHRLLSMVTGTGIGAGKLDTSEVQNLGFKLPHPDEQAKIAAALSAMDTEIAAVTGQLDRMQDFKKGLLQQMFV